MAFPAVQGRNESATTTASATAVVSLPASISEGDLLVVFIASPDPATFSGTGWTRVFPGLAQDELIYCLYKIADGTEGSTASFASDTVARYAHLSYRITGHDTTTPVVSGLTDDTGTGTTPDPPSLTPGGGAKDRLWIAAFQQEGEEADDDTWCNSAPSGYGNLVQKTCGTAGGATSNCSIAAADKQANASSDDPGTFSVDQSKAWSAITISVEPGTGNQNVSPSGLGSAQSFGTPTIVPGGTSVSVSALASASSFGTPTITSNINVSVTGLGSASSFGTATAVAGNVNVPVTGLGSAQAFGSPTIVPGGTTVQVSALGSASAFGTPSVSTPGGDPQTVEPTGLGSASAFGTPTIVPGNATVAPSGLGSAQAFGSPTMAPGGVNVPVSALGSASAFGSPSIAPGGVFVSPGGLGSASSFGSVTMVPGNASFSPGSLASASAFGTPSVTTPGEEQTLVPIQDFTPILAVHGG